MCDATAVHGEHTYICIMEEHSPYVGHWFVNVDEPIPFQVTG
jgi:hypothetical protein